MFRKVFLGIFLTFPAGFIQAQSLEDFLACADFTDRVERVICLEEALEAASAASESAEVGETPTTVEDFGQATEAAVASEDDSKNGRGILPRIRMPSIGGIFGRNRDEETEQTVEEERAANDKTESESSVESFGRERARVVANADGTEELRDVVAELDTYRNMLVITLESGQVWRQTHSRRFNLRVGDAVSISPSRWGESFRLEAERLNGFIQVGRMQ
ncbi:MAG: hypothetical protein EBS81_07135 [Gammaproteobacteria bacterium]|nr:hypothetical protein [Gammaproteobacteria bacterium]